MSQGIDVPRSRFVSSVSAKRETKAKTAKTAKPTENNPHTKKQKKKKKLNPNQIQFPPRHLTFPFSGVETDLGLHHIMKIAVAGTGYVVL